MKKNLLIVFFTAILVVTIGIAGLNVTGAQALGAENITTAGPGYGGQGNAQAGTGISGTSVLSLPVSDLNAEERAALLFMVEEEKLARDVYNTLYSTWNLSVFQNIAGSEQTHMDQLALLLTRYNLISPIQTPGVFTDPKLQALYNTLVAQGSQSLSAAIKVGAAIEEIDILDLQTRLAQTDNADIQQVYNNLMKASYNHLKAFANTLSTQGGGTYTPQYMSVGQYQAVNASTGSAGRPSGAGQGGATR